MNTQLSGTKHKNADAALVGLTTQLMGLAGERLERSLFLKEALNILTRYASCDTVRAFFETDNASLAREEPDLGVPPAVRGEPPPDTDELEETTGSTVRIPIEEDGKPTGYLQFSRSGIPRFNTREFAFLESLSRIFTIAFRHWSVTWSLQERVKEISCLYRIANVLDTAEKSIGDILVEIVKIIPSAWLYSEDAVSRIHLDGQSFCSTDYVEGRQEQHADIVIGGRTRGSVQVAYLRHKPELDEGPFLAEERKLLDTIAKELSLRIERRLYEDEQEKIKEQLKHSNRLAVIGQLAAAVAHELNEPLTNILGFAQLAAKEAQQTGQAGEDLEKIIANSLHAREIVRKLLLYGRKMPQHRSQVDINNVIKEAVGLFEHRLRNEDIALELGLQDGVKQIIADPAHLRQVVANLVLNSIHAMPNGGTLALTSMQKGQAIEITIRDTGCGISEANRDKVFIPFFTTKESGHGTGLGLTVVLEIITGLGGTIGIDSEPGAGTTVLVTLPAADPEKRSDE